MKAPIILAVDTPDLDLAKKWVAATSDSISVVKLGLEFFLTFGHQGVISIKNETDAKIFLDLKLHDIPHTVAGASRAVSGLSPDFLTVHAAGGAAMIKAATDALPNVHITAVTILTSLSFQDCQDIGFKDDPLSSAVGLAKVAVAAGARAIVSSPHEVSAIRTAVGKEPVIITPGVRPALYSGSDDQKRTMTPAAAIQAGATYVVIGRPITQAWSDGMQAMTERARLIADEILN